MPPATPPPSPVPSSIMPPSLPHDIWLNVAQYLSPLFLRDLYTVNHSFYEIAMDCRYRQLIFAYLDDRMLKNIARLQDPAVAKRVKILHIDPSFLPLTENEPLDFSQSKPKHHKHHQSLRSILGDIAHLLLEQKTHHRGHRHPKHPKNRMLSSLKRRDDLVQLLSEVFAGLVNVTEYYVSWYGLPTDKPIPLTTPQPTFAFLANPFHANLRKLSLNLSLHNIPALFPNGVHVLPSNLEELRLSIHSEEPEFATAESDVNVLSNFLAPAMRRVTSSLRTLVISSWEPTDLSPLFDHLALFAALEDLSLHIPVEPMHLGCPHALNAFLQTLLPTLRCLRLRPTQYGGTAAGLSGSPDLRSLHHWIAEATRDVEFARLEVLDLTSSLFAAETTLLCISRFATPALASLVLTGGYRGYDEVVQAVRRRRLRGLKQLRIGPVSLCPELLDLLADNLPSLQRLELLVKDVYHVNGTRRAPAVPRRHRVDLFLSEMQTRFYPSWGLRQLSVLANDLFLPPDAHYPAMLEEVFKRALPRLRWYT